MRLMGLVKERLARKMTFLDWRGCEESNIMFYISHPGPSTPDPGKLPPLLRFSVSKTLWPKVEITYLHALGRPKAR